MLGTMFTSSALEAESGVLEVDPKVCHKLVGFICRSVGVVFATLCCSVGVNTNTVLVDMNVFFKALNMRWRGYVPKILNLRFKTQSNISAIYRQHI